MATPDFEDTVAMAASSDDTDYLYILWRVLIALVAAAITYLVYLYQSPKPLPPITPRARLRRRNTEQILASVYSSARVRAARMRKSRRLMNVLGIEDTTEDFEKIDDRFETLQEVSNAVAETGLETTNLIFGIDFTKSNLYNGRISFNGNSLHKLDPNTQNPYQKVISILGKTLAPFDQDGVIPVFGFGDESTQDKRVFCLNPGNDGCQSVEDVLNAYNEIVPKITFAGPTDFAPLIRQAVRIVEKSGKYHVLVIIGDGQITAKRRTQDAIVEASHYPLSIIMVGVGDGPWKMMVEFDDELPKRKFDNFQFIHFESTVRNVAFPEPTFALHALMEIPDQYREIKEQGLLGRVVKEE